MAISETARKNHDALFPGHVSTLAVTDIRTRELLTLSVLISLGGADPQVKGHVRANPNVGNDRRTMLSVITQLLPFVGYPRMLNALRAVDEVAPAT